MNFFYVFLQCVQKSLFYNYPTLPQNFRYFTKKKKILIIFHEKAADVSFKWFRERYHVSWVVIWFNAIKKKSQSWKQQNKLDTASLSLSWNQIPNCHVFPVKWSLLELSNRPIISARTFPSRAADTIHNFLG